MLDLIYLPHREKAPLGLMDKRCKDAEEVE